MLDLPLSEALSCIIFYAAPKISPALTATPSYSFG